MNSLSNFPLSGSTLCKCTVAVVGLLGLSNQVQAAKKKQPNVIFILTDDQRYNSLGITGDNIVETPNIDKLASDGVFFDRTYITSALSGPSRSCMVTGQWERKSHISFGQTISREIYENSFMMQLKKAGYSTAFMGKKNFVVVDRESSVMKTDIDFGFYSEGQIGFYPAKKSDIFQGMKNQPQLEGLYESLEAYLKPGNEYDYFYENATEEMQKQLHRRDADKPFMVWMNINLPHASSIGGMGSDPDDPEYYRSHYADQVDNIPLPEGYPLPVSLPANVMTYDELMNYYKTADKPKLLSEMVRMKRAVYGIDLFVGKTVELLEELGEADNTIIIYCSDNGLYHGEHGLGGQALLYEEGAHVPMFIYSPFFTKAQRGKRSNALVTGQDISATILEMCGLEVPDTYQSESLLPIIEGKKDKIRDYVFLENNFVSQNYPRQEAVRGDRYKYTRFFSKENDRKYDPARSLREKEKPIYEQFFDLETDPKEDVNLATDPKYKDLVDEYRKRCDELVLFYSK